MTKRLFFKIILALFLLFPLTVTHAAETPVQKVLLVFGDSLVAGYGVPENQSFPAQLQAKLGTGVKVIPAGVSGDTTAGGLNRLDWILGQQNPKATHAIVVLGGNDMLRGIEPKITRGNFEKIMDKFKAQKIDVLLAGMKSFRNLGNVFGSSYDAMYEDLADDYDAVLYPFFLDGVAMKPELNLDDGIHPTAAGIGVIVDKILPDVNELLSR